MKIKLLFLIAICFVGCSSYPRQSAMKATGPRSVYATPAKVNVDYNLKPRAQEIAEVALFPKGRNTLIVIDPGHGGEDFGTKSLTKPKYHEKYLNLTTALTLNNYLQSLGYNTLMTRSKDEFISLQGRADFANKQNAHLFISVHYNSAPSKEAEGVEIFYYKSNENLNRTQESKKLATAILSKVIRNTDAKSRGVKQANFAVIRETKMTAVLIECGFLTNDNELEKIKDPSYIRSLAWGIAQGVQNYLNQ